MDIPIRFKFFDKLKLYQDYLKKDSMLEKTKNEYWLCEKSIMLWAYSEEHKHLGVPLNSDTFTKRKETIVEGATKIGQGNIGSIRWVKKNAGKKKAIERVAESLITLELATKLPNSQGTFIVSLKGFLLGELLFETYENPGYWSKNFRKYKLVLLAFYATFIVLFLTIFLVFLEQLFKFISPETFVRIFGGLFSNSWWSMLVTFFLLFLLLRKIWGSL